MTIFQNCKQEILWVTNPKDSIKIRVQWVTRPNENIKKILVFFNGRSEWIEKYNQVIDRLFNDSYQACLTLDYRGQGKSAGVRGLMDHGYSTYVDDFQNILRQLKIEDGFEFDLVCHSMGGLIALNCIQQGILKPKKLVLCSPLLGLSVKPVPDLVSRWVIRSIHNLGIGWMKSGAGRYDKEKFIGNKLTHSKELFQIGADEDLRTGSAKFSWIHYTLEACDRVHQESFLSQWNIPTLILLGTEERVVEPLAIEKWYRSLLAKGKTKIDMKYIAGARHELLNESDVYRERVIFEIKEFLKI